MFDYLQEARGLIQLAIMPVGPPRQLKEPSGLHVRYPVDLFAEEGSSDVVDVTKFVDIDEGDSSMSEKVFERLREVRQSALCARCQQEAVDREGVFTSLVVDGRHLNRSRCCRYKAVLPLFLPIFPIDTQRTRLIPSTFISLPTTLTLLA